MIVKEKYSLCHCIMLESFWISIDSDSNSVPLPSTSGKVNLCRFCVLLCLAGSPLCLPAIALRPYNFLCEWLWFPPSPLLVRLLPSRPWKSVFGIRAILSVAAGGPGSQPSFSRPVFTGGPLPRGPVGLPRALPERLPHSALLAQLCWCLLLDACAGLSGLRGALGSHPPSQQRHPGYAGGGLDARNRPSQDGPHTWHPEEGRC